MAIRIRDIDHVVLRVADVDRAMRFYCDVLGCTLERTLETIGLYQLRAGRSMIDLMDLQQAGGGVAPDPGNMDHVALRVEQFDEAAIRAHLAAHGVAAGPVETRYGAEGDGPSMYIHDPDGNMVELKGPPAG